MPTLAHISVHPIKALDSVARDRASITEAGGLEWDRVYAIVDADGEYVNGKRTAEVHRIEADYDLDAREVTLGVHGEAGDSTFHLDDDRVAVEAWLSDYFGLDVHLEVGSGGAQTDSVVLGDGSKSGPTVISAATLREVASWFEGIDAVEMRERLRPNLVIEDVPAFWEDRLFADGGRGFQIGDVTLEGIDPIPRCVVPTRDPHSGEVHDGFRETFLEKRKETFPAWGDREAFDGNLYKLMTGTRVPRAERDGTIRVGDEVRLLDAAAER